MDTSVHNAEKPRYADGNGSYNLSPQDFYTIYNVNPILNGGNLGASAVVALPEPTDMHFGTVDSTTGQATGGDVATFRSVFGVPGTLNMVVMHGAGSVSCPDPNINADEGEATLDAEWANALAPSAKLLFMACPSYDDAINALVDNNLGDVISSSYGNSEGLASDLDMENTQLSQAAAQGQTFVDAAGDSGSDTADQDTSGTAIAGFNVDQYAGNPLVLAVGGTDFQDRYDADRGGLPQTNYWSDTNSQHYEDALGYIPETPWNASCADSIIAADAAQNGQGTYTGAAYCAVAITNVQGAVVGGGGGFSALNAKPAYQNNLTGLSAAATKRATPDIAFFAASGFWGHAILLCDSQSAASNCGSPSTFGGAGGTSFTAPQTAGIIGLLVTKTGERQGLVNPGIYALARAQFTASATASACYSNGQTSNTGITAGLPAAGCIFHDITTGNNDVPCQAGATNCYVDSGATYGMLPLNGANSLVVGYPAGPGYDEATGLGSLDVTNFLNSWNQAYSSSTGLSANPTSITAAQSTTLTATVTGGNPAGYPASGSTPPTVTGTVNFSLGMSSLGSCVLSNGACTKVISGSSLQNGSNTITATYSGSETYPTSSNTTMVTVTGGATTPPTITFTVADHHTIDAPFTVSASSNSAGAFTYSLVSGPASINGNQVTLTGAPGIVLLQADQAANGAFSTGSKQTQFNVNAGSVWAAGTGAAAAFGYDGTLLSGANGFTGGGWTAVAGGIAFDSLGQAWVAVPGDGVSLFDKFGAAQTASSITSGGINGPAAIAIDGLSQV